MQKKHYLCSEMANINDIKPILPALAVDAACSGNPGIMEFRGVVADTGTEVFRRGPFPHATNNIGEFLALVLGLAYLKKYNLPWVLYTDSVTALAWVREKRCKSKLDWNNDNQELFLMVRKAEEWLRNNTWTTEIRLRKKVKGKRKRLKMIFISDKIKKNTFSLARTRKKLYLCSRFEINNQK